MRRYEIDPEASRVWIEARSTLHPIRSESGGLRGYLAAEVGAAGALDLASEPQASLELPLEALSSGNPLYDRVMRRRVDARRFPLISGRLTSLRAGAGDDDYRAEGDLTFRGVTRRVAGEVTISPDGPDGIVVQGEQVFDVRDFGLEPPRIMMLRVFPQVSVRVRIVARHPG